MAIRVFLLLLFALNLRAQDVQVTSLNEGCNVKDTLCVSYHETKEGLEIAIINTRSDTAYLFSTYLESKFFSSKHLHRIDIRDGIYKISFTPIIPLLYTKRSDLLKFDTKDWVLGNQNLYSFKKLLPNTKMVVQINYADLFKNLDRYTENAVADFDPKRITSTEEIATLSSKDIKRRKLKLQLEFAVYNKVDLLTTESAYYLREKEFLEQAKSFNTICIPLRLKNYTHPLFLK